MGRALDILDWVGTVGLSVDMIDETVCNTLVCGAQKPEGRRKQKAGLVYRAPGKV